MSSDRKAFIVLLILAAALLVLALMVDISKDDFYKRCEAAGGKPVFMRSGLECMKKELFVEVGDE